MSTNELFKTNISRFWIEYNFTLFPISLQNSSAADLKILPSKILADGALHQKFNVQKNSPTFQFMALV